MKTTKFINGKMRKIASRFGNMLSKTESDGITEYVFEYWQVIDGVKYVGKVQMSGDGKTCESTEYIYNGKVCFTEFQYSVTALTSNN